MRCWTSNAWQGDSTNRVIYGPAAIQRGASAKTSFNQWPTASVSGVAHDSGSYGGSAIRPPRSAEIRHPKTEPTAARPIDAIRAAAGGGVDILAGTTRDEFRFFLVPSGIAAAVTAEALPTISARFGLGRGATELFMRNRPGETPGDVLCALLTDHAFRSGTADLIDAVAACDDGLAWQYEFAWPTPVRDLRACHALELAFVFDTLADAPPLTGPTPPQALADEMHTSWVQFAITGDPGWERVGAKRPVRTFGDSALGSDAVVVDPRSDELNVFMRS
jgi:para-nitrobenzyl esterase